MTYVILENRGREGEAELQVLPSNESITAN